MPRPLGLFAATLAALGLFACGTPPPAATTTGAAEPFVATGSPGSASRAPVVEGPPRPAPRCRLTATDTEGCGPRDVEELVAPVRPRLERCRSTSGGKLTVRVRRSAGKLAFDVEPGSSLDPTERQCVLDALASLDADESSTAWAGLNVKPTGFTSLLTIEW
jgi:hypothetical protein